MPLLLVISMLLIGRRALSLHLICNFLIPRVVFYVLSSRIDHCDASRSNFTDARGVHYTFETQPARRWFNRMLYDAPHRGGRSEGYERRKPSSITSSSSSSSKDDDDQQGWTDDDGDDELWAANSLNDDGDTDGIESSAIDMNNPNTSGTTSPATTTTTIMTTTKPTNGSKGKAKVKGGQFVDVFRYFHDSRAYAYTWWSTTTGARQTNYGCRIDYILASSSLLANDINDTNTNTTNNGGSRELKETSANASSSTTRRSSAFIECDIMPHVKGSDHCPVMATFNFIVPPHCLIGSNSSAQCDGKPANRNGRVPPLLCAKWMPQFAHKQSKLSSFFGTPAATGISAIPATAMNSPLPRATPSSSLPLPSAPYVIAEGDPHVVSVSSKGICAPISVVANKPTLSVTSKTTKGKKAIAKKKSNKTISVAVGPTNNNSTPRTMKSFFSTTGSTTSPPPSSTSSSSSPLKSNKRKNETITSSSTNGNRVLDIDNRSSTDLDKRLRLTSSSVTTPLATTPFDTSVTIPSSTNNGGNDAKVISVNDNSLSTDNRNNGDIHVDKPINHESGEVYVDVEAMRERIERASTASKQWNSFFNQTPTSVLCPTHR
jgi:hypothetical protein